MKKAGLIIGILLLVLSVIGGVICLLLPSLTNNRINFNEAILGFIPAAIIFIFGLIVTVISALLMLKSKKTNN
jgi:hypothetical protein